MKDESLTSGLEEALTHNPGNKKLRLLLISEYVKETCFEKALEHAQLILEKERNSVPALLALSRIKEASGAKSEAIVILERVLTLTPSNANIHYQLSLLKLEEGLEQEAKNHYEEAKRLDPNIFDLSLDSVIGSETPFTPPSSLLSSPLDDFEFEEPVHFEAETDLNLDEFQFHPEGSNLNFADVGGMEFLKRDVRLKIILPLKEKELFSRFHGKVGGSFFLYGPPGCGKTYFCEAVAGEQRIPFYRMHLEDILDSYTGLSEKNLAEFFEQAKKDSPSILFLDQIDALAGVKKTQLLNQTILTKLLQELEQQKNQNVLILGTSNQPWTLEEPLLAASRFERIYFIPPPDLKTRNQVLDILMESKPQKGVQTNDLAKKTQWYTAAELNVLVSRAMEFAIEESLEHKRLCPITMEHFEQALEEILPVSARSWLKTAYRYAKEQPELYHALLAYLEIHQLD